MLDPDQTWRIFWLLRQLAKTRELSESELQQLSEKADATDHWIARLNLCQLFAATGVPATLREDIFPFLRESFGDHRVIVRAWAISALAHFGNDMRFRAEIGAMIRKAQKEGGKSMQARLRYVKPLSDDRLKR